MKRKDYQKPAMRVVELRHRCRLLDSSPVVQSVRGNVFNEDIESDYEYSGEAH